MNPDVEKLVMELEVDLRVDYMKREHLPDEVRPKMKNGQAGGPGATAIMPSTSMFTSGNETSFVNMPPRPDHSEAL